MDTGTLRRDGGTVEITNKGNSVEGKVSFSVFENGVDYAVIMHEWEGYNLSRPDRKGGTGMSGKKYEVGRKYLERPFEGEKETYLKYIEQKVDEHIKQYGK